MKWPSPLWTVPVLRQGGLIYRIMVAKYGLGNNPVNSKNQRTNRMNGRTDHPRSANITKRKIIKHHVHLEERTPIYTALAYRSICHFEEVQKTLSWEFNLTPQRL